MVFSRTVADMTREPVVTFASWMTFGFPTAFLILIACYFWMCISAFGYRRILKCETMVTSDEVKRMKQTIQGEYSRLGNIKFSEVIVLLHFFALVVLWMFRFPGTFPGWATFFKPRYVTDGTTAIALAVSLFVFPNTRPNVLFFRRKGDTSQSRSMPAILTWKTTSRKVPWGVLFLLGGGFALSEGIKVSGLSKVIASNVMFMQHMPAWLTCLLVIALTSALTEVSSNTVVAVLLLPMLKNLAAVMRVHPLYLMLPATVASSLAFMLPMATAPNALVFAYGDVKVIDMVKTGLALNVFGIGVAVLGVNTWGDSLFDLGSFPAWASITSV
ncbi:Na(+)/citrate cotransporter-like [Physella acuta]|uniref:Na(+)/citrate cotransporter-like n=1 Tax=Physella acuta TaxID=109671 RepID=UPI0027DD7B2B|nr:Na(+)/citrate cotransporter-like [Physella acuta]